MRTPEGGVKAWSGDAGSVERARRWPRGGEGGRGVGLDGFGERARDLAGDALATSAATSSTLERPAASRHRPPRSDGHDRRGIVAEVDRGIAGARQARTAASRRDTSGGSTSPDETPDRLSRGGGLHGEYAVVDGERDAGGPDAGVDEDGCEPAAIGAEPSVAICRA